MDGFGGDIQNRPWGYFQTLLVGNTYQVKKICVLPGESLSLQSHNHRSEHWIVVQGIATVRVGDIEEDKQINDHIYIPLGEKHRLSNGTIEELVIVEVQLGKRLSEDDIIRYEDKYGRTPS